MYLPDKDGFFTRGKGGRHKYSYPINTPEIKIRFALPAWVKIKELIGIYKIKNRNCKHISMISKLSSSPEQIGLGLIQLNRIDQKAGSLSSKQ